MDGGRYGHTATLLPNGKVLVAGGFRHGSVLVAGGSRTRSSSAVSIAGIEPVSMLWLYDPVANAWSEVR